MKHATRSITQGLGDAVPARAGREPSLFHVSALAGDHRLSRLVPTFVCRTHYSPSPRGHRTYLGDRKEWRR
jgi:hypothetical protein